MKRNEEFLKELAAVGGPFHPHKYEMPEDLATFSHPGATLRDAFAMAALARYGDGTPEMVVKRCYELADAMLKERLKCAE